MASQSFNGTDARFLSSVLPDWSWRSFALEIQRMHLHEAGTLQQYAPIGRQAKKDSFACEVVVALVWEMLSCWTAGQSPLATYTDLLEGGPIDTGAFGITPSKEYGERCKELRQAVLTGEGKRAFVKSLPDRLIGMYLVAAKATEVIQDEAPKAKEPKAAELAV